LRDTKDNEVRSDNENFKKAVDADEEINLKKINIYNSYEQDQHD
jgi:hypothetical protein